MSSSVLAGLFSDASELHRIRASRRERTLSDPAPAGAGSTNMRDRLAAVNGELETRSSPGGGTRLVVTIPLEASA